MILIKKIKLTDFLSHKETAIEFGDKELIMMTIFKKYGFEAKDNNEADSFALAAIGASLLGYPLVKTLKPQAEVLKLLEKQICKATK